MKHNGEPIDVLSRWTILRNESGISIGRLIIDTDLTETHIRIYDLRLTEERVHENESIESVLGAVYQRPRNNPFEQRLALSENRYRSLVRASAQFVWLTDPVGTITFMNERFLAYIGIPVEESYGFDWSSALHPEEREATLLHWMHSVETSQPYIRELRMRGSDGSFRYFLARALAMRNDGGKVERWVGSCTDIHEQKIAEEALRRSEKLAATGRLAASIAHEINNPLEAVTNSLYLALGDQGLSSDTRS